MTVIAFIISILLPGLGQVLLSRYWKGLIVFFSIIILLDMSLVILPCLLGWQDSNQIRILLVSLALIIYLYNLWDIFNIIYWKQRSYLQEKKNALLKQGIIYYLQNDLDNAKNEFMKALKIDDGNIDTLYYLSKTEEARGKASQARKISNQLSNLDFKNKWLPPLLHI
jgi:tetratricopeptide (TPR) repeat protein